MSAESGSIALQDVGRVFWVEGLECAPLERDPNLACGFLIATVDLQKNGQVLENRLLIKFLTATKTALLAKTPARRFWLHFYFTNVKPCGTRCGNTYA